MSQVMSTFPRRRAHARRMRAVVAGILLLPGATGCYSYVPLWNGSPQVGTDISLGLSDRGRTALAGPLGPGARLVAGRLVSSTDSAFVIGVREVTYIGSGTAAKWNGEQISVPRDYVSGLAERRLSKSRSWIAVGIAVGVAALATTVAVNGFGTNGSDGKLPGGQQSQ